MWLKLWKEAVKQNQQDNLISQVCFFISYKIFKNQATQNSEYQVKKKKKRGGLLGCSGIVLVVTSYK